MSFCRLVVHLGFRFTFLKDNVIQFRLEITAFHLWAVAYFWRAFVLNILNSTVPERTVNIVISELMKTISIDHNQYKDKFVMVCSPIANFVIIMSAACSVENWDDKASVVYILCQVIFFYFSVLFTTWAYFTISKNQRKPKITWEQFLKICASRPSSRTGFRASIDEAILGAVLEVLIGWTWMKLAKASFEGTSVVLWDQMSANFRS